jgi:predicted nucleotidyltransferase
MILMNEALIEKSKIIKAITTKIQNNYIGDISLFVCYGSYVTGDYTTISDIDFFFVPKTERGYRLECQFIINDIGYDLWPVSWERLNRIADLDDHLSSIIMDGRVIYASSGVDLERYDKIKEVFKNNLRNENITKNKSWSYIDKAKAKFFDLQNNETVADNIELVEIAEVLLFALAMMNGTYTQKGIRGIKSELARFSLQPHGFINIYEEIIQSKDRKNRIALLKDLINDVESVWKARYLIKSKKPEVSGLNGFYEEFKSTYNKLIKACREKDYNNAYYAAYMIDRETTGFLSQYVGFRVFPGLGKSLLTGDYQATLEKCREHEDILLKYLKDNNIDLRIYKNMIQFEEAIC